MVDQQSFFEKIGITEDVIQEIRDRETRKKLEAAMQEEEARKEGMAKDEKPEEDEPEEQSEHYESEEWCACVRSDACGRAARHT